MKSTGHDILDAARLALGSDIVFSLVQDSSLREMLQRCTEAVATHLGATFAAVWTFCDGDPKLTMQTSAGPDRNFVALNFRTDYRETPIGAIAGNLAPLLSDDAAADPRLGSGFWSGFPSRRAFAGLPLIVDGIAVGVMAVFAAERLPAGALEALADISNQLALGIVRRRTEERLGEEARALATLQRIGKALASELDLKRIVQLVTDEATKLSDAQVGAFFYNMKDHSGGSYMLYTLSGSDEDKATFQNFPKPRATKMFGATFNGEGIVRSADVRLDPRYGQNAPHDGMPEGHIPFRSYLALPVVSRTGPVIGGLFFGHRQPAVFQQRHERLLEGIAQHAAIAIENAQLYQDLKNAKEAADEANQAKSHFLANMSHEIRTPLGAIVGFAELMEDPDQSPSDRGDCIATIIRNGDHLLSLVDDILDLSKVEAGHLQIDRKPFSLPDFVRELRLLFGAQALEKNITFQVVSDGAIPKALTSDPMRVRQILVNLVSNALKFTEQGGVTVTLRLLSREGVLPARFEFQVKDTGCGISGEQSQKLFRPFVQADSSTTRRFGGTGLGLALSRRLSLALDSELSLVESAPGGGSVFALRIPCEDPGELLPRLEDERPQPAAVKAPVYSQELGGLRILLVEDTVDIQRLVTRILDSVGAHVEVARNGEEGVAKALRGHFDVVLMDVQMPVLDGYEATQRLRAEGFRGIVIALTAHAMKEERERCLAAGADDHLTKPIGRTRLIETISRHAHDHDAVDGPDLSEFMDDPEVLEILKTFRESVFPSNLAALEAALARRDLKEVSRIAHMLKGSVGGYLNPSLPGSAEKMEKEAKGEGRVELLSGYMKDLRRLGQALSSRPHGL